MTTRTTSSGFTLIELSIVLVIIGLIVGGVLTGRDLIRAAELRSVISDIEKFNTAVHTFQGKYGCLPGDCRNATQFFGASSQCSGGNTPLGSGTCNGNGNGQIATDGAGASEPAGVSPSYDTYHSEDVLFWQHLSLAGLVAGSYSGGNPAGNYTTANVPFSRITNGCYGVAFSEEVQFGSGAMFVHKTSNEFYFGSPVNPYPAANNFGCSYSLISPGQARGIDSKIDDGNPDTGSVTTWAYNYISSGAGWNPCITASPPYQYALSSSSPVCELIFSASF